VQAACKFAAKIRKNPEKLFPFAVNTARGKKKYSQRKILGEDFRTKKEPQGLPCGSLRDIADAPRRHYF
jgi:hypothetical protein